MRIPESVGCSGSEGFHRPKNCSGFSLRAAVVATVFVSCVAVASGEDKCQTIKDKGYKIGFNLNGLTFDPTFNGTLIDLLKHYNKYVQKTKLKTFKPTTARLLLGYDGNYIALPYIAGDVIERKKSVIFLRYSAPTVRLKTWISSNAFNFSTTVSGSTDFGVVDPAIITLFHDVIYAGTNMLDVTTKAVGGSVNIDPRITYETGNHFDLTNWTSVNAENKNKTLIGVVDGKKVLREESCDREHCTEISIKGPKGSDKSYCFSMEKPELPTTTPLPTTTLPLTTTTVEATTYVTTWAPITEYSTTSTGGEDATTASDQENKESAQKSEAAAAPTKSSNPALNIGCVFYLLCLISRDSKIF
ncbi:hypothetical protein L596_010301 [Steinernema carpocapsae]|uniref:Uncharacterized protein n=1 Tax=Steinernema carpocapsae TaxID=34508 RepID=A0A4U5PIE3_STECR|nr:hypothetical protein L596_010301 [Steinernema carpocapsae]